MSTGWRSRFTTVATVRSTTINKYMRAKRQGLFGELNEGPAVPTQPIMQSMPSVSVDWGLQLPSIRRATALIRLPPGSLPRLARQGHRHQGLVPDSWRTGKQWQPSCPPPQPFESIITPGDRHSFSPGKEEQDAAGFQTQGCTTRSLWGKHQKQTLKSPLGPEPQHTR